jgi:hypothetical protein
VGRMCSNSGIVLMQFCLLPESELRSAGRLRGTEISLRVREISVQLKSQSAGYVGQKFHSVHSKVKKCEGLVDF